MTSRGPGANYQRTTEAKESSATTLLYLRRTALLRRAIEEHDDRLVANINSNDVAPAPRDWIAYVEPREAHGERDDDFLPEPVLHLLDPSSGRHTVAGAGFSPLWSPDGTSLAYLRPVEPRSCFGESCSGSVEVVVLGASSAGKRVLLEPGRWTVLAWAGDRLLVSDAGDLSRTVTVSLHGERGSLPLPPSRVWGASPDGRWLVTVAPRKASFVPLREGEIAGNATAIPLGNHLLAEGAWSHDSLQMAAVLLPPSPRKPPKLALLSPERPHPRVLTASSGAAGMPLWATSDDAVLFPRVSPRNKAVLQALYCSLQAETACRTLLSWRKDVTLLRLE